MKKKHLIIIAIVLSTISGCYRVGDCKNGIELSRRRVIVNSNENTTEIITPSTWWWLEGFTLNGKIIDISNIDRHSKNFIYSHSDFQFERKEDGKKIVITMKQNNTDIDRILIALLREGNCFNKIKIIQTK